MRYMFELVDQDDIVRPVFRIKIGNAVLSCIIDTGANMSVCCNRDIFTSVFPQSKSLGKIPLTGFGKGVQMAFIREVPMFVLTDSYGNELYFYQFHACVYDNDKMVADLILGFPLFKYTVMTVDWQRKYLCLDTAMNEYKVCLSSIPEIVTDIVPMK